MSDLLNRRGVRPVRNRRIPTTDLTEWKAKVFLAKGWQSKIPAQTTMQTDMKNACRLIEAGTLQADTGPDCASALEAEDLSAGKEFKAYLAALKYFEKAAPDTRRTLVDGLRKAAQDYIDHFNDDHSKRQKRQKQNIRKKAACEGTLSDLRKFDLKDQVSELGDPPWTSEVSMKAASTKMMLDIESVPPGQKGTEVLGGVHEFPAFWINKPGTAQKPQQAFLFKPTTTVGMNGFEGGGDTAREAAVGRMGDLLAGMTGLDFGVPETNLVSVGQDKLPDGPLGRGVKPPEGGSYTGSLQTFARTGGEMRDQPQSEIEQVSANSSQKMILLDMLTLNCDRHGGNMLVKPGQQGAPELVPIDHGQTFPPNNNLTRGDIANKLGDIHSATLYLPSAHEPFTPEMKTAIGKLDPDAMKAGMKLEMATIGRAHPSTQGKVSDESLEMSRRSALFLKAAVVADPALTPAAAQVAFGQNAELLLAPDLGDNDFHNLAADIISRAAGEQDGLRDYMMMSSEQQLDLHATLVDNGYPNSGGTIDRKWLLSNITLALKLARGNVKNPSMMEELKNLLGQRKLDEVMQSGDPLYRIYQRRLTFLPGLVDRGDQQPAYDKQQQSELDDIQKAFPGMLIERNRGNPTFVRDTVLQWVQFGREQGMLELDQAIDLLGLKGAAAAKAHDTLTDAINVVSSARNLHMGPEATQGIDLDGNQLQSELDYITTIANELTPNNAARGLITTYRQTVFQAVDARKKAVRTLRIAVQDAIRAEQMPRLKAVRKTIETAIEEAEEDAVQDLDYALADIGTEMVTLAGGSYRGAEQRTAGWEQRYPAVG